MKKILILLVPLLFVFNFSFSDAQSLCPNGVNSQSDFNKCCDTSNGSYSNNKLSCDAYGGGSSEPEPNYCTSIDSPTEYNFCCNKSGINSQYSKRPNSCDGLKSIYEGTDPNSCSNINTSNYNKCCVENKVDIYQVRCDAYVQNSVDQCLSIVPQNYARCCGGLNSSINSSSCKAYTDKALQESEASQQAQIDATSCSNKTYINTGKNYLGCCALGAYKNLCTQDQIADAIANSTQSISQTPGGTSFGVRLKNPLGVNTIQDAVKAFMGAIVRVAIPFIVIFFIYSGFTFITARGNPTEITKAKQIFSYTIIGTLLILGAWAITNAIVGTINSIS